MSTTLPLSAGQSATVRSQLVHVHRGSNICVAVNSSLALKTLVVYHPRDDSTVGKHVFYVKCHMHQSYLTAVDEKKRGPAAAKAAVHYKGVSKKEFQISFTQVLCTVSTFSGTVLKPAWT